MINLLPPKEKELFLLEIKKRMFLILWFLFLSSLACFILILFLINSYLVGQLESERITLEKSRDLQKQSEFEDLEKKLDSFNKTLEKLDSFYSQRVYFSDVIAKISSLLPEESYLDGIFLNSSKEKDGKKITQVSLSGFILNRESLFDFKKTLEKEKDIKEISFPASNWIKPVDINFQVTFKISK